jgi:hypothetical protein
MEDAYDQDNINPDLIHDQIRQRGQDEFPRARFSAGAASIGKSEQFGRRVVNRADYLLRSIRRAVEQVICNALQV